MSKTARRLGALERLWVVAGRLSGPFAATLVVEGSGQIDISDLRAAVERVAAVAPGFSLKLTGRLGWTKWLTTNQTPAVVEVDGSNWDGMGPSGAPFLQRPLNLYNAEIAEVLLVKGDSPRVVFRAHHAVTDGIGMWGFASRVGAALRQEEIEPYPAGPLTDIALATTLGGSPCRPKKMKSPNILSGDPSESEGLTWARVRVNTARPSQLLAKVLVALASQPHLQASPHLLFDIPVDMRRASGQSTSGNLASVLRTNLQEPLNSPDPVTSVSAWIKSEIEQSFHLDDTVTAGRISWISLNCMTRASRRQTRLDQHEGRFSTSATVSNLGVLDPSLLSGAGFNATRCFWVPPGHPSLPMLAIISGDDSGFDLVATSPNKYGDSDRLRRLLDSIKATIEGE